MPDANQIGLLGLFQVDLDNMDNVEFAFMYHMQISPEQIGMWPYYRYERHVEQLIDILKKKEQAEKNQTQQTPNMDPGKEAGKLLRNVPKLQAPSFKTPKFK